MGKMKRKKKLKQNKKKDVGVGNSTEYVGNYSGSVKQTSEMWYMEWQVGDKEVPIRYLLVGTWNSVDKSLKEIGGSRPAKRGKSWEIYARYFSRLYLLI